MTDDTGRRGYAEERAVLLVAGVAELAVSTVGTALGAVGTALGAARGLLRRADTAELAADAGLELEARGRLVLERYAAVPPAQLEILARHVLARRAAEDV